MFVDYHTLNDRRNVVVLQARLKTCKGILLRGLFFIMALQILNLSIDVDCLAGNISSITIDGEYDDIDSISEFLLEKVVGDNHYTSEEDDDEGDAPQKGFEKYESSPLYSEPLSRSTWPAYSACTNTWVTGLDQANKTSKGYFYIISLPPEA